jgi:mono/diheme cytochrome c family protein
VIFSGRAVGIGRDSLALALALALLSGGCTRFENAMASIPVFSFMRNSPAIDPYEAPRPAPPHSVPFSSPAGNAPAPMANTDSALRAFGATAVNPLSTTDSIAMKLGQVMYDRHCSVCHGPQGHGDGSVINKPGEQGKFPFAPNLTLPMTAERTDGYLYGIIDVGRGLMPPYGPRMSDLERWATVNYVRQLQRASGANAAPPAPSNNPPAARAPGARDEPDTPDAPGIGGF